MIQSINIEERTTKRGYRGCNCSIHHDEPQINTRLLIRGEMEDEVNGISIV